MLDNNKWFIIRGTKSYCAAIIIVTSMQKTAQADKNSKQNKIQ
jgi:hypothetical protein